MTPFLKPLSCLSVLVIISLSISSVWPFSVPTVLKRDTAALRMNILSDIGDMLSGGSLAKDPVKLPHIPLGPSTVNKRRTFAVQERALSFSGEDFDVVEVTNGGKESFCSVRGAMLHLPGKDKMSINDNLGNLICSLDRKLVAVTPTYDIYRSNNNEKLGWIEKKVIALNDAFDVYMEGKGGVGPFKPPPAFSLDGDFLDRTFVMKNAQNEVVAKVVKDSLIQFDAFNHYQVQVAPGMDAFLVVACCCAIDEEFDEEHKARKEKEEGGGGWF